MKDKALLRDGKKLLPGSGMSYHKFKKPAGRILQVFKSPLKDGIITFETNEVSALCPLTSQPDWYKVKIEYMPCVWCIESKSAKLYFGAYRDFPGFIETIAQKIYDDWKHSCSPKWLCVTIEMAPRGGIAIKVTKNSMEETN